MKTILITGGAGFIGANFLLYFLEKYPNYRLINLDKLTYAADTTHLTSIENSPRYQFVQGDISNRTLVEKLFQDYKIKDVIHFAAESHVDNSIKQPDIFMQTNVIGTFTLLDVAYKAWFDAPNQAKIGYETCRFHHISTDEVYGSLGTTGYFTENTPYAPSSPYSASKASSDMLVRSYYHTYGLNTLITNCSNNYGQMQHQEKLIPTIIANALAHKPIPIYGDGKNIRDWLHVLDHCRAIDSVFHQGEVGETYNIGGDNEKTNLEVVHTICHILNQKQPHAENYTNLITFVTDRAGHDKRYAIDATKIKKELGWLPQETFETGIEKTINWYLQRFTVAK